MSLFLIILISACSIIAFNRPEWFARLQFNPYQVYHQKEVYRFISHAFVHADWIHLIVNMMVLYFFGSSTEDSLNQLKMAGLIRWPAFHYFLLFFLSTVLSSLSTLKKYKDDPWYNSVGASGFISAFIFSCILFDPWQILLVYFIPVPGIVFGVLYLIYCQYMSRRSNDNINHDAHLFGALVGFFYPMIVAPELVSYFFQQLFHP